MGNHSPGIHLHTLPIGLHRNTIPNQSLPRDWATSIQDAPNCHQPSSTLGAMARVRFAALLITMAAAQTFMQRREVGFGALGHWCWEIFACLLTRQEIPVLKAPQDNCWVLLEGSVLWFFFVQGFCLAAHSLSLFDSEIQEKASLCGEQISAESLAMLHHHRTVSIQEPGARDPKTDARVSCLGETCWDTRQINQLHIASCWQL